MDLEPIIEDIKRTARALNNENPNLKFYFFGSITGDSKTVNDIDILVIYQDHKDLVRVRKSFAPISKLFPLDFIFLNRNEEKDFDFQKVTGAIQIE